MAQTLDEHDWKYLLYGIKNQECTPVIGAGTCAGTLPLSSEIARSWAMDYGYPFYDDGNLSSVSQYLAIMNNPIFPKEQIKRKYNKIRHPNFGQPDEPHAVLADLNLPIYITTNYDSFMFDALRSRNRDPKREVYRWNNSLENITTSVFDTDDYEPTAANPLVFHLNGHVDALESLVLTEDDYLNFLGSIILGDHSSFPNAIQRALASKCLLFVGFDFFDSIFNILFPSLVRDFRYPSFAVLSPAFLSVNSKEGKWNAQQYIQGYFEQKEGVRIKVYWGDTREFTMELRQRWEDFIYEDL